MDSDEQDICNFLMSWPRQFLSAKEISRRAAGKRRASEDPFWAHRVLPRMVEKGLIESDSSGHYRLSPPTKKEPKKKWIAPQIQKILEESGKDFDGTIEADEPEDPQRP